MRRILLLFLIPLLAGCSTTQLVSSGEMAAMAPMLSVERFLQATNARDLDGMARLFGTSDGPIIDTGSTLGCAFKKMGSWIGLGSRCRTAQEVELQMDLIAQVLRHQDYTIQTERAVPGRVNQTSRVGVDLRINNRMVTDVPFIVVRTGQNRWLVEEIGLQKVTGGRRGGGG